MKAEIEPEKEKPQIRIQMRGENMKYRGKRCFGILMLAVCGVIAGCSAQKVYQDQQKVRGFVDSLRTL